MNTVRFTPEFTITAEKTVTEWKNAKTDPADALRALEKLCAKHGEEFHPDGTSLVEKIYDGKFDGGQAINFVPNQVHAAEVSTATPISATVAETATSTELGVDAKAVSTTPVIPSEPKEEDIASHAASTPTLVPEAETASEHPTAKPETSE